MNMDKLFLLTYTCIGYDGFRREYNAWFSSETEMKEFIKKAEEKNIGLEIDIAIEILSYRSIEGVE